MNFHHFLKTLTKTNIIKFRTALLFWNRNTIGFLGAYLLCILMVVALIHIYSFKKYCIRHQY